MDLSRIKNLVKKNGDKIILVENDEPEIVMMSFSEYAKLTAVSDGVSEKKSVQVKAVDEQLDIPTMGQKMPEPQDFWLAHEEPETEFLTASAPMLSDMLVGTPADVRLEDLPI